MRVIQRLLDRRVPAWLCPAFQYGLLAAACLGLIGQVVYDGHLATAASLFPQWLLLASLWHLWRQRSASAASRPRDALILALIIPVLSCLTLVVAWIGWKTNNLAICGVIPISDSASYYASAQSFVHEAFLDPSGQRRPLNILLTSAWLLFSGDHFKLLLVIQVLAFSAAALLASATAAALHGFRAGLLLFALLLVFAEPYLPTVLSENNGFLFGALALVGFIFGLRRRSLIYYCGGLFCLAMGLAIRPSALFVLPAVLVAGVLIFGASRVRRWWVVALLGCAMVLPTALSISLNKTLSHSDGSLNSNLSYTIYGLVSGGKGWEQYEKENPGALGGLTEAERSHVITEASWRRFKDHPTYLVRGLVMGQIVGPVQTFAQMVRLAFLGAAGDPLRIISPVIIVVICGLFAGVLLCRAAARRTTLSLDGDFRLFCTYFLAGYLLSIPFFFRDGGLRLQAPVMPVLMYMIVRALLPPAAVTEAGLADANGSRLLAATGTLGIFLLGCMGLSTLEHPSSHRFDASGKPRGMADSRILFRFAQGWPQCDLSHFDRPADGKPRWFSGAIPDDNYRSAAIREIAGKGRLYFGVDVAARDWKILYADRAIGQLNLIELDAARDDPKLEGMYRDYASAKTVDIIDPAPRSPSP